MQKNLAATVLLLAVGTVGESFAQQVQTLAPKPPVTVKMMQPPKPIQAAKPVMVAPLASPAKPVAMPSTPPVTSISLGLDIGLPPANPQSVSLAQPGRPVHNLIPPITPNAGWKLADPSAPVDRFNPDGSPKRVYPGCDFQPGQIYARPTSGKKCPTLISS